MTDKDIERLINKYLDGETTPAEECRLARELQRTDIPGEWQAVRLMLGELALGEAEYDAIMAHRSNKPDTAPRQRRLWPLAVAACVAGIIAFLLWPKENTPLPTSPIVAGKGHPQERPKADTKTQLPQAVPEQKSIAAALKPRCTASKSQPVLGEPQPEILSDEPQPIAIAEPVILEELSQNGESPIPTDRQALVNIYLAETALQIAYQLQDQLEDLRVYSASLEGKETQQAKPIIAF